MIKCERVPKAPFLASMSSFSFLDNKYTIWYFRLCRSRQLLSQRSGYLERHHVIPTKLGGANSPENTVLLTAREHFIAHWLLTKMLEGEARRKMCYALSFFRTGNRNLSRNLSSRQYEVARKALSLARKGVSPSENCKRAVSLAKKGVPLSLEQRQKIGLKLTKKKSFWAQSPSGEEFTGDDVRVFARERGLREGHPVIITAGRSKGWIIATSKIEDAASLVSNLITEASANRTASRVEQWKKRGKRRKLSVHSTWSVVECIHITTRSLYGLPHRRHSF